VVSGPSGRFLRFWLGQRLDQAVVPLGFCADLLEVFGSFLVRLALEPLKRMVCRILFRHTNERKGRAAEIPDAFRGGSVAAAHPRPARCPHEHSITDGADLSPGSGSVGLKPRVEALGDKASVKSPIERGTTLRTELP
jgi:hypothetical protein